MSHKDRNIAIAKKWFIDMWSRGDVDLARQIVHPDYNPDWIHIPKKGPDQVIHEMKYFRSIFPDLEYEILDSTSDESKAWVRYRGNGTHKGVAWGFSPTQKNVSFEGIGILEINKEGEVINQWDAYSFYDILEELGVVPPLWELKDKLK